MELEEIGEYEWLNNDEDMDFDYSMNVCLESYNFINHCNLIVFSWLLH